MSDPHSELKTSVSDWNNFLQSSYLSDILTMLSGLEENWIELLLTQPNTRELELTDDYVRGVIHGLRLCVELPDIILDILEERAQEGAKNE